MPRPENVQGRLDSIHKATGIVAEVRTIFRLSKTAQASLLLYQAGTDAVFNEAVDAVFTSAERQELNQMLTQLNALVNDWSANHAELLEVEL